MTEFDENKKPEDLEAKAGESETPVGNNDTAISETEDSSAKKPNTLDVAKEDSRSNLDDTTEKPKVEKSRPETHKIAKKRRAWGTLVLGFIVILLCISIIGISYYGYTLLEKQKQTIATLAGTLNGESSTTRKTIDAIDKKHIQSTSKLQEKVESTQSQLVDINQRVSAQGKRLRAMSDTSREDWLLAEAEYLLKLANQRVRIERNAGGAEALLEEADGILRDLDDPDLHPLRRAVARDLASLRLMNKVDVEGIYLTLVALAEQVDALPMQLIENIEKQEPLADVGLEEEAELSVRTKLSASWQRFKNSISESYRVIPKDQKPKRILPPDATLYVQQNLRMILERAQLALLREQQNIYQQSLTQAQAWINTYYNVTLPVVRFREELSSLKEKKIALEFPDISHSLELLHEHIENIHKLKGVNVSSAKVIESKNSSGVSQ